MGNWLKKLCCCFFPETENGVPQGPQNALSGPPQFPLNSSHDGTENDAPQGPQNAVPGPPQFPPTSSHDGTENGVPQGPQNAPLGPPQSPLTGRPTLQDGIKYFKETADTLDMDALIQAIEQLYMSKSNPPGTSTTDARSESTDLSSNLTSAIDSGAKFLQSVNEYTKKMDAKVGFFSSGVWKNALGEVFQKVGNFTSIPGVLSLMAYVLNKFDELSGNRSECLYLFEQTINLVDHIKKLKGHMPEEEKKLREALVMIVEVCITCASQLNSEKKFSLLTASDDSKALKNLNIKINNIYQDLNLTTIRYVQKSIAHRRASSYEERTSPHYNLSFFRTVEQLPDNSQQTISEYLNVECSGENCLGKIMQDLPALFNSDLRGIQKMDRRAVI